LPENTQKCTTVNHIILITACFHVYQSRKRKETERGSQQKWITNFCSFNYENDQEDALYKLIYYSKSALHVLGDVFAHHQEHLTIFTVQLLLADVLDELKTHPRHQPAATWVNTIR
jgi:hypothetical protein